MSEAVPSQSGVIVQSDNRLESSVDVLYRNRFEPALLARRAAVWKVICGSWLSRYIPIEARVLEIGAGYCEFINSVSAAERVAVDMNPESQFHAAPGVLFHRIAAENLTDAVPRGHFDTVFMSNFLEHCRSRDQVLAVLRQASAALRRGGRLLIVGPNFKHCYKEYFDYFDHHLPLTDNAVVEAVRMSGFVIEHVAPRTLPFTFRSSLPSHPFLVRLYLKLPVFWRFFGAQFLVVARKGN